MVRSIVVVCVGNICRSPVGERLLSSKLSSVTVSSAGLSALVGQPADPDASMVAASHGLSLSEHVARQLDYEIAASNELILVMESGHHRQILRHMPQLAGRVMLYDQWTGAKGIPDPYKRSQDFHEAVYAALSKAADAWVERLK